MRKKVVMGRDIFCESVKIKDRGLSFIISVLLKNDRFKYYDFYLNLANKNGYKIISFTEYLKNGVNYGDKILILRHDIDNNISNVKLMYDIERKNNATATYYFRWSTLDVDLVKEMHKNGFEIGLHYETLATYAIKNNIHKHDQVNEEVLKICRKELKEEIEKFKGVTGILIDTIANHGHYKNIELGISNNTLVEGQDYNYFSILCEAYDKKFYETVNTHIMDTSIEYNYGFAYKDNPIDSIIRGDKVIVFLSHPEHWRLSVNQRIKLAIKLVIGKFTFHTNRVFTRIKN